MSRTVVVRAPAKINLFLRVLGARSDGFHDVQTLLQCVDLYDEVSVQLGGAAVHLTVEGPAPCPPRQNLAWLAAERFAAATGLRQGVRIRLAKLIPAGAGLGGGSSDAAAVLRALCHLSGVDGSGPEVKAVAAGIGADVPFFLCGSPLALATGRGDVLEALDPLPEAHAVLSIPSVHVPTASAYAELDRARAAAPPDGGAPAGPPLGDPPTPASWEEVAALMHNDFEAVVASSRPEIRRSLDALLERGATAALLSGSGAASFGLFPGRAAAEAAARALSAGLGWPCRAVRTLVDVTQPT